MFNFTLRIKLLLIFGANRSSIWFLQKILFYKNKDEFVSVYMFAYRSRTDKPICTKR
jgi:hypothetical protein